MKVSAKEFWNVWKEKIVGQLDEHFKGSKSEKYSKNKVWTSIIFNDDNKILEPIASKFNLTFNREDYHVDTLFCSHENLKHMDGLYPLERVILFEHENDIDSSTQELYKLLYRRSPLKVIVTYLYQDDPEKKLLWQVKKFSEMIAQSNEWFPENPSTEYLIIIGRRNDTNDGLIWFAVVFDTKGFFRILS